MADTPEQTEDDVKKGKPKLLIVIVAVVLLAGAGFAATTMMGGGGEPSDDPTEQTPEEGEIVTIGDMTTGLDGDHYVRVSMSAVLAADAATAEVEKRLPLLRDRALTVLLGRDADELSTVEGVDALRTDLTDAAQHVYDDGQVVRIVLTDLLVQ